MRVLILGGTGMLGHKLAQVFSSAVETYATVRDKIPPIENARFITDVDARNEQLIKGVLKAIRPDVLINAIGLVKQLPNSKDVVKSLEINSIFPHKMAEIAQEIGARFITVSTDCVFKGDKGNYSEEDLPDADDIYGKSKYLGEVITDTALTIRTSIIGRELVGNKGLVEWFLSQKGKRIRGYTKAVFSGLSTLTLSEIMMRIVTDYPDLNGLYHIASQPISKYTLLSMLKSKLNFPIEIEPDDEIVVDRSLNASRFKDMAGIEIDDWDPMLDKMIGEFEWYEKVRNT